MPSVAEMNLLGGSLDDLSRTLLASRQLKQQKERAISQEQLDREMMGLRRAEGEDARNVRREGLAETARHHGALEKYQAAIAAATKEENASKRDEAMFKLLTEMGKEGMLTDDALRAMESKFGEKFGPAGVGVKLFKLPPESAATPQAWKHPVTGRNYTQYGKTLLDADRPRARRTLEEDPTNPGQMKEKIVEDLTDEDLQGLREAMKAKAPPPQPTDPVAAARLRALQAQIAEEAGQIEKGNETVGPFGIGGTREARIRAAQEKIARMQGAGGTVTAPAAPTAPVAPTEQDFLTNRATAKQFVAGGMGAPTERVRVIGPDGKVGTIPRAQLSAAMQQGYKLAEAPDEAREGK